MTQITNLPLFDMQVETRNNADADASIAFVTEVSNEPVDLTGITFKVQLRHPITARGVPLEASTTDGKLQIGGVDNNYLVFAIPQATMALVPVGVYDFDIRANADGKTIVVARGTWRHVSGVTRS
jgi:hypothetical protein